MASEKKIHEHEPPKHLGCDFFSGWVSGIAGNLVGHPMDTVKVFQQIYGMKTMEAITSIHRKSGFSGYYRGISMPFLTSGVLNSLFFGGYGFTLGMIDSYRHLFQSEEAIKKTHDSVSYKLHRGTYFEIFLAGCVAGVVQIPVACPSELIKIKVQATLPPLKPVSPMQVIKEVIQKDGFAGFYRGSAALCCRDIPSSGLYVLTYEYVKDVLNQNFGNESKILHQFIAGGLAGSTSWIFVVPFDTIKSQMQVCSSTMDTKRSLSQVMSSSWKTQGIAGLSRGTVPIALRAFPVNGITFLAYEYVYAKCMGPQVDEIKKSSAPSRHHVRKCRCIGCFGSKNCVCRKL